MRVIVLLFLVAVAVSAYTQWWNYWGYEGVGVPVSFLGERSRVSNKKWKAEKDLLQKDFDAHFKSVIGTLSIRVRKETWERIRNEEFSRLAYTLRNGRKTWAIRKSHHHSFARDYSWSVPDSFERAWADSLAPINARIDSSRLAEEAKYDRIVAGLIVTPVLVFGGLIWWACLLTGVSVDQSKLEYVGDEKHHPSGVWITVGQTNIKIGFSDYPESDPDRVVARVLKDDKKVTHATARRHYNKEGAELGKHLSFDFLEKGTTYEVQVYSPASDGNSFVRAEVATRHKWIK